METQIIENNRVDQFLDRTGLNWKVRTEETPHMTSHQLYDEVGLIQSKISKISKLILEIKLHETIQSCLQR